MNHTRGAVLIEQFKVQIASFGLDADEWAARLRAELINGTADLSTVIARLVNEAAISVTSGTL